VARALGRAWERQTGGAATLAMAQALHALDCVHGPARPASGRLRGARADDLDILVAWMHEFAAEAALEDAVGADAVTRRLEDGLLHIWEDGGPVSMVGTRPPVAGVVRIAPVYTPPARRGLGYASSAVAAVSRAVLAAGARRCALYTDLANPTSNRIYAALGYRRVAEWEVLAFAAAGGTAQNPRPS
jgi:predicted GNAT family acetyltransferase